MKMRVAFAALLIAGACGISVFGGSPMQTQGEQAFASKDYATALPLLQQAADFEKGNTQTWPALRDKIEECKKNLTAAQLAALSWHPAAATLPGAPRTAHDAPKAGETRVLSIKELGNFDYDPEKTGQLPDDVAKLNGIKVSIWGFMIPNLQADKVTEFALVPSLAGCCYGQPPGVEHTILIHSEKLPVEYTTKPIRVIGTLHVEEKREAGYTIGLFEITPEKVDVVDVDVDSAVLQGKAPPANLSSSK